MYQTVVMPKTPNTSNGAPNSTSWISESFGNIEFSYNMFVDGNPYASSYAKGFGVGLTGLSIAADFNQINNQYIQGGMKNVNPFTAARAGTNFIGVSSKIISWTPFAGRAVSYIGRAAGFVGIGISTAQSWWMIYEKMDALRFAPLYLDKTTGDPYYGDPVDEYYYYKSIDEWR
jgi:hypothetical protein